MNFHIRVHVSNLLGINNMQKNTKSYFLFYLNWREWGIFNYKVNKMEQKWKGNESKCSRSMKMIGVKGDKLRRPMSEIMYQFVSVVCIFTWKGFEVKYNVTYWNQIKFSNGVSKYHNTVQCVM